MGDQTKALHERESLDVGVGSRLGPYELVKRLGAGGMGEGYFAVKTREDGVEHRVFLKRILAKHRNNSDFARWFSREAAIVATLRHANIVTLIEADPECRYLAFELVDGPDLAQMLRYYGRLPPDITCRILTEVCKALQFAHSRASRGRPAGVIHRDLSPHNILIAHSGGVKVTDFGVAAVIHGAAESQTSVAGKRHYQSPEERREQALDGRSDIFSLGVTAYEMLTGKLPYDGSALQIARDIDAERRVPLREAAPDVPVELAEVVDRMLRPNPVDRFASAVELEVAIHRACPVDPMVYLDVGKMAARARPHETVETSRDARSESAARGRPEEPATAVAAEPATARVSRLTNQIPTVPQHEELDTPSEDVHAERMAALISSVVTSSSVNVRPRRLNARVYAALGVVTLVGIGIATQTVSETRSTATSTPTREALTAAGAQVLSPTPPDEAKPAATITDSTPPANASQAEDTTVSHRAEEEPVQAERRVENAPTHSEQKVAPGTLIVGALPQAQVWIDRKLVGWSRVVVQLPPGEHFVTIGLDGRERPNTRQKVTVVSGGSHEIRF